MRHRKVTDLARDGAPQGKDTLGLGEDVVPDNRVAGVVRHDGSPTLPAMKPATSDESEGNGEAGTGAGTAGP